MKHVISFLSALWVLTNLLISFILLLIILFTSILLPIPLVRRSCIRLADCVYRTAVKLDSFWMQRIIGIELVIKGKRNQQQTPVVICNHQSWFDIPLVQHVISGDGPIIKFLVKREIIWVPVIGWICMVLRFPRLRRSKQTSAGENDFSIIKKASKNHGNESGALLIFPEGTRFTEAKRRNNNLPYRHLLRPKKGGLKLIQEHTKADTQLIDITINYHQKKVHIWRCLHGNPAKITITLDYFNLDDIDDVEIWLNKRWLEKDQILANE